MSLSMAERLQSTTLHGIFYSEGGFWRAELLEFPVSASGRTPEEAQEQLVVMTETYLKMGLPLRSDYKAKLAMWHVNEILSKMGVTFNHGQFTLRREENC